MLKTATTLVILIASTSGNQNPYGPPGGYPGQFPPQGGNPYGNPQQQQSPQGYPPGSPHQQPYGNAPSSPGMGGRQYPPPPPPGYPGSSSGSMPTYGRGPPPMSQQQQPEEPALIGGFFSKLKSGLASVGAAITGEGVPPSAASPYGHSQQMGGGGVMGMGGDNRDPMGQQRQQQRQQQQQQYPLVQGLGGGSGRPSGPPPGYHTGQGLGYPPGTGYGAPNVPGRGMIPGQEQQQQQQYPGSSSSTSAPPATTGFLGKLKNLFAGDEGAPGQGLGQGGGSPYGNRPPPPPPPGMQHGQGLGRQPPFGYLGSAQGQGLGQTPGMPPMPPPLPTQQQQYGGYPPQRQGLDEPQIILDGGGSSAASVSAGLDGAQGLGQPPMPTFPGMSMSEQQQQQSQGDMGSLPAAITTDPQMVLMDDCVVLVLKPSEFHRKKAAMAAAGSQAMQVFCDFEHVLTHAKVPYTSSMSSSDSDSVHGQGNSPTDAPRPLQRSLGSGEVLECAPGAISPSAVQQLRAVTADFSLVDDVDMDEAHFADFTSRCQAIIASQGSLHLAAVAPATRELLPRLGLRDGWKEALQALALGGVPTYVFSSGHGDVVAQAFLLEGLGDAPATHPLGHSQGHAPRSTNTLPSNLRIISNFFRTAPDGTVRAFSSPVVHERNKNATTAARHMGFPLPERSHALVLGSHEDDVAMTEGAGGITEQLSVGFLELSEDLAQRLPHFLATFDAVVLGESSFQYARAIIEDLLGMNPKASSAALSATASLSTSVSEQRRPLFDMF